MTGLLNLLEVRAGVEGDAFIGNASGPEGKRAYGGLLAAQSLAAACRTVGDDRAPTNMHLQFLRGGNAGESAEYRVQHVYDGRTASARRVESYEHDRMLTTATVSFATELAGPEHGIGAMPHDPEVLPCTGPPGPAPSLPLDEFDIRIADEGSGQEFVRRMWWRVTAELPEDPLVHMLIAVYITDLYGIDPALAVHGHSMRSRSHRSGTTDSSIWFHRPVRAGEWNLLESRSPATARGRGVITSSLLRADGAVAATLVQEGLVADRVAD
ncbi:MULTISPECIES: acyl-CoA thioesterase [Mycolicibacterium]|uniref:Acyl-CoA thioesterase n=1 Tax=Mycolicibacterium senegalense TaxID=1796 RepID=A0A378T5U4_9MYCO|nr:MULTISPECIES: acyl-CoA thioesterase domain-containing protein [Mycolicibacterium]MCV7336048.1 thioesterase family protein [Mycolicibacterium senegalense]MDR7291099.1 acyl-CoA thioesterase-2 [Mycolicibacterium senegalense]QZA22621.1 thioesterase family protein [Mycolicibacterium senegalense]CDP83504.1 acyl-CoA thioesterase [Mycolicibacterium farcinogenes]STZ55263.1 acyl-CoA thioesterase [Mycolicibacterium senegalense]